MRNIGPAHDQQRTVVDNLPAATDQKVAHDRRAISVINPGRVGSPTVTRGYPAPQVTRRGSPDRTDSQADSPAVLAQQARSLAWWSWLVEADPVEAGSILPSLGVGSAEEVPRVSSADTG